MNDVARIVTRWNQGLVTTVVRYYPDDEPSVHVLDPDDPDENGLSILPYLLEYQEMSVVRVIEGRLPDPIDEPEEMPRVSSEPPEQGMFDETDIPF